MNLGIPNSKPSGSEPAVVCTLITAIFLFFLQWLPVVGRRGAGSEMNGSSRSNTVMNEETVEQHKTQNRNTTCSLCLYLYSSCQFAGSPGPNRRKLLGNFNLQYYWVISICNVFTSKMRSLQLHLEVSSLGIHWCLKHEKCMCGVVLVRYSMTYSSVR